MRAFAHFSSRLAAVWLLVAAEVAQGGAPTVTETALSAGVVDIKWIGPDANVALLLTQDNQIFRSADGGKVWTKITAAIGASLQVLMMVKSAADKNTIAVIGRHLEHYVSTDMGATWRTIQMPAGKTRMMWFHDSRPEWVMFSAWTHSCTWVTGQLLPGEEADDGGACNHVLYASRDLGRTFFKIAGHVVQFDWGDAPFEDRIYFTHFKNKKAPQPKFDHWMADVEFAFTDLASVSATPQITEVIDGGNKFVIAHGYILVATVKDKMLGLMVSKDAGVHFKQVEMPRHLKESSYIVLDTSEAAVVLHVNHGNGIGHIYVSDLEGVHYTLSLQNNVRGKSDCGFDRVMNLRGIYLANVRDPSPNDFALAPGTDKPTPGEDESESLLGGLSTSTQADRTVRSLREDRGRRLRPRPDAMDASQRRLEAKKNIRTVVTFDRGGAWSYLKAPSVDSRGAAVVCPRDSCWLHMHDITEWGSFAPFYSYTNAVGIVMGSGNVGPYLSQDPAATNTYLSRDGGLTWAEASKGNYIYEFGNHGGLLLMTDWARETTEAFYSTNQGHSWASVTFASSPMNVSNILTENSAMSEYFVLFGTRGTQAVMYHIDLATLGLPVCKGLRNAGLSASDYESWTPSDGKSSERCLLGRQSMYTRRKQLAGCSNSRDTGWPVVKKNCTCTDEDFECASGFTRAVEHMSCKPEHQSDFYEDEAGKAGVCYNKDFFYIDRYRKISGDTCTGGQTPEKIRLPCKELRAQAIMQQNKNAERGHRAAMKVLPLVIKGVGASLLVLALCFCWRSKQVQVWISTMKMSMSGGRDYSRHVADPPSAANDPTNIGAPTKPAEMYSMT